MLSFNAFSAGVRKEPSTAALMLVLLEEASLLEGKLWHLGSLELGCYFLASWHILHSMQALPG